MSVGCSIFHRYEWWVDFPTHPILIRFAQSFIIKSKPKLLNVYWLLLRMIKIICFYLTGTLIDTAPHPLEELELLKRYSYLLSFTSSLYFDVGLDRFILI